jgi:hypothetical protein
MTTQLDKSIGLGLGANTAFDGCGLRVAGNGGSDAVFGMTKAAITATIREQSW